MVTQIADWNDFDAIRNNLTEDYELVNDLDQNTTGFSSVASGAANSGDGFEPIGEFDYGSTNVPFEGTLNGNGYAIADLVSDRASRNIGLFKSVSGTLRDITIQNCTFNSDDVTAAPVCYVHQNGFVADNVTVDNCTAHSQNGSAGLISYIEPDGNTLSVTNCTVINTDVFLDAPSSGTNYRAAGLIGNSFFDNTATIIDISDCTTDVDIEYNGGAPQLAGVLSYIGSFNGDVSLSGCDATVNSITFSGSGGAYANVGGIVGYIYLDGGTAPASIDNCTADLSVSATGQIGGIVALTEVYSDPLPITDCEATGSYTTSDAAGGIVGVSLGNSNEIDITQCLATPTLTIDPSLDNGGAAYVSLGGINAYAGAGTTTIAQSAFRGTLDIPGITSFGDLTVGGLCGWGDVGNQIDIVNSYVDSDVTESQHDGKVGGVFGHLASNNGDVTFQNCYNVVPFTDFSNADVGAIAGVVESQTSLTLENIYWDTDNAAYGTGGLNVDTETQVTDLPSDQMTGAGAAENMTGFDFDGIWRTAFE